MAKKWTDEQLQCIETRGGTVLVSAAAGSGKTSVLVERVIGLVTDAENPVDIDRLLVVTFTNAAASEMKQRLAAALSERIAQKPDDLRLLRQQMLVARANISTVHGFCSSLIREHFHLLGLPPQFRVAETAETAQMADEALNEIVEELYQENSPEFIELTELLSPGKDDRILFDAIQKIHTFMQSHPYPEKWLAEKQGYYAIDLPAGQTSWGRMVLDKAGDILKGATSLVGRALALAEEEPVMAEKYADFLRTEHAMLENAASRMSSLRWDEAIIYAQGLAFGTLPQLRNYGDQARKERVKTLRDKAKKDIKEKLLPLFCGDDAECREDINALSVLADVLFDAVGRFGKRYAEKKLARGLVDYNDLEHMALRLLVDEDGNKTSLSAELSSRFDEVLVDEYQDTNAAQDALFRALSRNESNLFMVGDVKQSIYGFRQAMPDIFLRQRDTYQPFDGINYPATITLGNNFRSRLEITDAVNFVFRQLMTKSVCGMNYDEREELKASAKYEAAEGYQTELLIIDGDTREQNDDSDAAEARVIAARIREIMNTLKVTENGDLRPARFGDFCILLRSKSAHAKNYADELSRCGIPSWTEAAGGFFASAEIASAVALLHVIDNPIQDIPLLAVLISPVFGFSPDDLTKIRLHHPEGRLYTALRRYGKSGDDAYLKSRIAAFLNQLDAWRLLAVTLPTDRLIHRIYEDTALTSVAAAMRHGAQRVANLRLLHDTARRFEQNGFRGLSAFVRMLDRAERQGNDIEAPAFGAEDAVRIMSIHHSKGLEFPFLFIAGMGRRFNRQSSTDNLLIHSDMGVGFKRRDPETLTQWNTLPRIAVSLAISKSELAEEMRVLYVAMTRAKEKLIMVMTMRFPEKRLASLAALIGEEDTLPSHAVLNATGMCDWILSAALRHPSGGHLRSLAGDDCIPIYPADHSWHIDVLRSPPPEPPETYEEQAVNPDMEFADIIKQRISYAYPYREFSMLPAKLAASELSHGTVRRENVANSRPAFLSESGLTPAERGTALHTFMQFADYSAAASDVRGEISRLVEKGYLTREQGRVIPVAKVKRFFESELYARIKSADRAYREFHFTIDIPATELLAQKAGVASEEVVIIQGIADCVLVENGGLVVIDYKTDHVKTGDILIDRYKEQLGIYARALERTLGMPVRECLLYSFALDSVINANKAVKIIE